MKIIYRKIRNAYGLAHLGENTIEIDSRIKGKKLLEILIHEFLHIKYPRATEERIVKVSVELTNILWDQGFRQVDNTDVEPMQDELG
jgi:hypothetical protein